MLSAEGHLRNKLINTGEQQLEASQVHVDSLTSIRPALGTYPITRLPHVHVNPGIDFVLTGGEEVGRQ